MVALYQFVATSVCRDVHSSVEARVLRLQALTDVGLFSEAILVLQV